MEVTYNHLYTHFIFTTQDRQPIIENRYRDRIEKYITGIINHHQCKLYAIYANTEHVHLLVSRDPAISEKELATLIANASENFINQNKMCLGWFRWQTSCSAFSVSKRDIDKVCQYILNQPQHHQTQTFTDEFDKMMDFYQKKLNEK
jgi:REP element-mobilizing transposase RayT